MTINRLSFHIKVKFSTVIRRSCIYQAEEKHWNYPYGEKKRIIVSCLFLTWLMTSCIDCSRMPRACSGLQESNKNTFLLFLSEAWIGSVNHRSRLWCITWWQNWRITCLFTCIRGIVRSMKCACCVTYQAGRCRTSNQILLVAAASLWDHGTEGRGRRWRASWSQLALVAPHYTGSSAPRDLRGQEHMKLHAH